MPFGIDVRLHYQLGDDPVVLLVLEAARTAGQTVTDERFEVAQAEVTRTDAQDGLGSRAWARVMGGELKLRYRATVDVTRPAPVLDQLGPTPVHALPGAAFTYLRPSRFCQSDMFQAFVGRRFGGLAGGPKVAAITEWVRDKLSYVPASSAAATTALDTFVTREGVCRDYAHVVCALARAAGIPARYAAAYAPDVDPPDFHAVAQVWLEGAWHMVDATGMSGRDGAALIAVGRDAGDVAFMETWAPASMIGQSVSVMRLPS
ncbi:transglutaminase-like domain-containing protein [Roseovarius tibetensis]|uniref:transglutaminase-like domain-containing protein n=1 Tax=Roseovarius tibetensis TaxID=2685897 RepID=UPI003D7F70B9